MNIIPRPPTEPTRVCTRCELHTLEKSSECVHCSGLSDNELRSFREQHEGELDANANLGKYFALIAAAIAILMFLASTND